MKPEEETKRGQTGAHTCRHSQWCWKIQDKCEDTFTLLLCAQKKTTKLCIT